MPLTRITITGADDTVNPADLVALSKEFPFVEWGILRSEKRAGDNRYPTSQWRRVLEGWAREHEDVVRLSAHFCGSLARDILNGAGDSLIGSLTREYQRAQLNGFELVTAGLLSTIATNTPGPEFILQVRDRPSVAAASYIGGAFFQHPGAVSMLWDASGGRGIFGTEWPQDSLPIPIGFAGGLGPDSILRALDILGDLRSDFWLDMETGVRTDDRLDLTKVRQVLDLTRPLVKPS